MEDHALALPGRIWSKISSRGEADLRSPGATLGFRGATFWVTYRKATKTTTLHISEGAGWIRRVSGGPTLKLKAGSPLSRWAATRRAWSVDSGTPLLLGSGRANRQRYGDRCPPTREERRLRALIPAHLRSP